MLRLARLLTLLTSGLLGTSGWVSAQTSVEFQVGNSTATEDGSTVGVLVAVGTPSAVDLTVTYSLAGQAASGADIVDVGGGSLVIPANAVTASLDLEVLEDGLVELDETLFLRLETVTGGYTLGPQRTHTLLILEDGPFSVAEFAGRNLTVNEGAGVLSLPIRLDRPSVAPVSVELDWIGRLEASEVTLQTPTVTFPPGVVEARAVIELTGDSLHELPEELYVRLKSTSAGTIGARSSVLIKVLDDDPEPTLTLSLSPTVLQEGGQPGVLELELDAPSGLAVRGTLTSAGDAELGADYSLGGTEFLISPGETSTLMLVEPLADGLYEGGGSESGTLTILDVVGALPGAANSVSLSIADMDGPPSVSFTEAISTLVEGDAAHVVSVQLSGPSTLDATVSWTVSGTATPGQDHALLDGGLTIPAGATTGAILLPSLQDDIDEPDETVVLDLLAGVGCVPGTLLTHVATLQDDDDAPAASLGLTSGQFDEAGGSLIVPIQLSRPSASPTTLEFQYQGSATLGTDLVSPPTTVQLAPFVTTASLELVAVDDLLHEGDEVVSVALIGGDGVIPGAPNAGSFTIVDDDAAPVVAFALPSWSAGEDAGVLSLDVTLSAPSGLPVEVPFSFAGTAVEAEDFSLLSSSPLLIPAGQTSAQLQVEILQDPVDEPDESLALTLGTPVGASLGATTTSLGTIVDDEAAPTLQFSAAGASTSEAGTPTAIPIELSHPSSQPIEVIIQEGGTALLGEDYTLVPVGPYVIPAGATSLSFEVHPIDDGLHELTEQLELTLVEPIGATLGVPATYVLEILDDDPEPTVSLDSGSQTILEGDTSLSLNVLLSAPSALEVRVPLGVSGTATAGEDYTLSATELVLPPGTTSVSVPLILVEDALDEPSESLTLTLGVPDGGALGAPSAATLTLTDDDAPPTVQFTLAASSSLESGQPLTIGLELSGPSGRTIQLPFSASGTAQEGLDYTLTSASPRVLQPGETTATIELVPVDDLLDELDEDILLTLGTPVFATLAAQSTHLVTLTDDDAEPTVGLDVSSFTLDEVAGVAQVGVSLSAASGLDVVVPFDLSGTATVGVDFTSSSSPLVIPAGSLTGTLTFSSVDDLLDEEDESILVTLGTPTSAVLGGIQATAGTLVDDDAMPAVQFTLPAATVSEAAGTAALEVALSAPSGREVRVQIVEGLTPVGEVVLSPGLVSGAISFPFGDDLLNEADELRTFDLAAPVHAVLGSPAQHLLTIQDDDPVPALSFSTEASSILEAAGSAIVGVSLSAPSGRDILVQGTREGASLPSLTILAGQLGADWVLPINDDLLDEADEVQEILLTSADFASLQAPVAHLLTVLDDDEAPTVAILEPTFTVAEAGGLRDLTVALSAPSGLEVQVPVLLSGTAVEGVDYQATPSTLVFPAGASTATFSLTGLDDLLDEDDETILVTLGTPTNATLGGVVASSGSILDDDLPPELSFSASSSVALEAAGTATLDLVLSAASGLPISFEVLRDGGLFELGALAPGETTLSLLVPITDDLLDEEDEAWTFTLSALQNVTLGLQGSHVLTVQDDDPEPVVAFSAPASAVLEAAGPASVPVQLDAPSGKTVQVELTLDGVPQAPLVFTPGATVVQAQVAVQDDALDGPDVQRTLELSAPTSALLGTPALHTLTIEDDDATPSVSFVSAGSTVPEAGGVVSVVLELDAPSSLDVTVPFTWSGDLEEGVDVQVGASPVVIPAGQTTASLSVTVLDDMLDEADEGALFVLGAPTNALLGTPASHQLFVSDDDGAPQVAFAVASSSVAESAGSASVEVTLSAASGLDIEVTVSPSGDAELGVDYSVGAATLVVPAGSTSVTYPVTLIDDSLDEADEALLLTLSAPVNANLGAVSSHELTVLDDDAQPSVGLDLPSTALDESAGVWSFSLGLAAASGQVVTVPLLWSGTTTEGLDHGALPAEVQFTPGQVVATVSIDLVDDLIDELDEALTVTLGTPVNASVGQYAVHTLTLADNDLPPTLEWSTVAASASEAAGNQTLSLALSAASGLDVEVPLLLFGSATVGEDYAIAETAIVIPAGVTSHLVTVDLLDDPLDEPDEEALLTLGTPVHATLGAATTATLTILDDDLPPTVGFASGSASVSESTATASAAVVLSGPSGRDVFLTLTVAGTATPGEDFGAPVTSLLIPAGATQGVIDLTLLDDLLDELDETIVLSLATADAATLDPLAGTFELLLLDDDETPSASFLLAATAVDEAVGAVSLEVQLSALSGLDVTLDYVIAGTATSADHGFLSGSLLIPAGVLSATIDSTIVQDLLDEEDETLVCTLSGGTYVVPGVVSETTLTILDDDATPTLEFTASTLSGAESAGTLVLTAQLAAVSGREVTAGLLLGGDALVDSDYTASTGGLVFAPGETTQAIEFLLTDDLLHELDEVIEINLIDLTAAVPGATTQALVTILDDDPEPSLGFVLPSSQELEASTGASVELVLSAVSGLPVEVSYTVGGTALGGLDYTSLPGSLVIAPGESGGSIVLELLPDALDELDETIELALTSAVGGTLDPLATAHVLTVLDDDDPPSVQFSSASTAVGELVGSLAVEVALSSPSGLDVEVAYSVSGTAGPEDHDLVGGVLLIPAGASSALPPVTILDDLLDEEDETLLIELVSASQAILGVGVQHQVLIQDDDATPTIQFTLDKDSVTEGTAPWNAVLSLSAISGREIAGELTAAPGFDPSGDLLLPVSFAIPAGADGAVVPVDLVADDLHEETEEYVLLLAGLSNAQAGVSSALTLTVFDDDPAPTLEFDVASLSVTEASGLVPLVVRLSAASALDVSAPLIVTGDALAGEDYSALPSEVLVPAGMTSLQIDLELLEDTRHEATESLQVSFGPPTAAVVGAVGTLDVTITDNDAEPTLTAAFSAPTVAEAGTPATLELSLSGPSGLDVALTLGVGGSALPGLDHSLAPGSYVIPAGQPGLSLPVGVVDDSLHEGDESLEVLLSAVTGAAWPGDTASISLIDDDPAPALTLLAAGGDVLEGTGELTLQLHLDAVSGLDVEVPLLWAGAADPLVDFEGPSSALIPAGQQDVLLSIPVLADGIDEFDESVSLTLGATTNTSTATGTATWSLLDVDPEPQLGFSVTLIELPESGGQANLELVLVDSLGAPTTSGKPVAFDLSSTGEAVLGLDLTGPASASYQLDPGTSSLLLPLAGIDDSLWEGPEDLQFSLASLTHATLGAAGSALVTVLDDESPSVVELLGSIGDLAEAGSSASLTLVIQPATDQDVQVELLTAGDAIAGTDYTLSLASPVTIVAGQTSVPLLLSVQDDLEFEGTETVQVSMGTIQGADPGGVTMVAGSILDDEPRPAVQFNMAASTSAEGGTPLIQLDLAQSQVIPVTAFVTIGAGGTAGAEDVEALTPVVIPAGTLSATLPVSLLADGLYEGDEQLVLMLGETDTTIPGAMGAHALTILDGDPEPTVTFGPAAGNATEGQPFATVPITLSGPSTNDVLVSWQVGAGTTASEGTDYVAPVTTQVLVPAFSTEAALSLELLDDFIPELPKTLQWELVSATGAALGAPTLLETLLLDDDSLTGLGQDFNLCGPDLPAPWTYVGAPEGDYSLIGAGTEDAVVVQSVVAGQHLPLGSNLPPRLEAPFNATNFSIEVAWNDLITEPLTHQGTLLRDPTGQWLRAEVYRKPTGVLWFYIGAETASGVQTIVNMALAPEPLDGLRMRLQRDGDLFSIELWDGLDWFLPSATSSFSRPGFTPDHLGLWVGNNSGGPAHEIQVDWVQDTYDPLFIEDGPLPGGAGFSLTTLAVDGTGSPTSNGSVQVVPDQASYSCVESVQLTAVPEPGYLFVQWTGDLPDPGLATSDVIDVVMDADRTLVAEFALDTSPPVIVPGTLSVLGMRESAIVRWTADKPCVGSVRFGQAGGALGGPVFSGGGASLIEHEVLLTGLSPNSVYDFEVTVSTVAGSDTALGTVETETLLAFDFNTCDVADVLAEWSPVDPALDLEVSVAGGGTQDAWVVLGIPGGVEHSLGGGPLPPRIEAPIHDTLFEHEVYFGSIPDQQVQMLGMLYRDPVSGGALVVTYQFLSEKLRYWLGYGEPDVAGDYQFTALTSGANIPAVSELGFRVLRGDGEWRAFRTADGGQSWTGMSGAWTDPSIPSGFRPTRVGLFVANGSQQGQPTPALDAAFDRIRTYDSANPWLDEDGAIGSGVGNFLTAEVLGAAPGGGSGIQLDPGGFVTGLESVEYFCEPVVQLTAVPGPCERFVGWLGDLSGADPVVALSLDASRTVQAIFEPDPTAPAVSNLVFQPFGNAVRVRWETDEVATSEVQAVPVGASDPPVVSASSALVAQHDVFLPGLIPGGDYEFTISGLDACGNPYNLGPVTQASGDFITFQDESFHQPNVQRSVWEWRDPTQGLGRFRVLQPGTADARLEMRTLEGIEHSVADGLALTLEQPVSPGPLDLTARLLGAMDAPGLRRGVVMREAMGTREAAHLGVEESPEGVLQLLLFRSSLDQGILTESSTLLAELADPTLAEDVLLRFLYDSDASLITASVLLSNGQQFSLSWSSSFLPQAVGLEVGNRSGTTGGQAVGVDFIRNSTLSGEDDPSTSAPDTTAPWQYRSTVVASSGSTAWIEASTEELAYIRLRYGVGGVLDQVLEPGLLLFDQAVWLTDLQPSTTYWIEMDSVDGAGNTTTTGPFEFTTFPAGYGEPPVVEFWNAQQVGEEWTRALWMAGRGQDVLNVQGNARDLFGDLVDLQVRINGGPWSNVYWGQPDPTYAPLDPDSRLGSDGDFNIEFSNASTANQQDEDQAGLLFASLVDSTSLDNVLELRAVDDEAFERVETLLFSWQATPAVQQGYFPDWSGMVQNGLTLDSVGTVIDGKFGVDALPDPILGATMSNQDIAFDRLFALGDSSLENFDVLTKVRLADLGPIEAAGSAGTNSYAFGLGLRWKGHFWKNQDENDPFGHVPTPGEPLRGAYWDTGAFVLWRGYPTTTGIDELWQVYHKYRFGSNGQSQSGSDQLPSFLPAAQGSPGPVFWIRATARSMGGNGRTRYGFKAWRDGDPEPGSETGTLYVPGIDVNRWTPSCSPNYDPLYDPATEDLSAFSSPASGSLLFFLNHVKVKVGEVQLIQYPYQGYLLHEDFDTFYPTYGAQTSYQPVPGWVATFKPTDPDPIWVVANRTGNPWYRYLTTTGDLLLCNDGSGQPTYGQYNFLGNETSLALIGSSLPGVTFTYQGTDPLGRDPLSEWTDYELSGRFYVSHNFEQAGPIFLSDGAGNHYSFLKKGGGPMRVRRASPGVNDVDLVTTSHRVDTGSSNTGSTDDWNGNGVHDWTRYRVQVTQEPTGTLIKVKAWHAGDLEPEVWTSVLDDSPERLSVGTVGLYGAAGGERFFDDVVVKQL